VFGKPVKIRHCPRNGKSESHSRSHWETGKANGSNTGKSGDRLEVSDDMQVSSFLHVAEGSAAKLLSAVFCCAMVLSVPL